ncbi:MAG: DNRLRE domain-containing protein, partial [Oscillospiraceae bacterium]|nr:DNRLRE domain-containing protein [Oscillospiraceae bacterium]
MKSKVPQNTFQYELIVPNQEIELRDNQLYVAKSIGEYPNYIISVPMMIDILGSMCFNTKLSLEIVNDKNIVTIELDQDWLLSYERQYEIRIDPIIDIPILSGQYMAAVEEYAANSVIGDSGYLYIGYDDGVQTGTNDPQFGHPAGLGSTRVYSKIPYSEISVDAAILNATFKIYQISHYSQNVNKPANEILLYRVDDADWNPGSITWNNQPEVHTEIDGPRSSYNGGEFLSYDITGLINDWIQGLYPNYGIVLISNNERNTQCERFNSPNTAGGNMNYMPQIQIEWELLDPVDENYPLEDLTINVRTITEKDLKGKQQFNGAFIDGMATPTALVEYRLSPDNPAFDGFTIASLVYRFPDSTSFNWMFPNGTKYKSKDSNWQSLGPVINLNHDVLYRFYATASKDNVSSSEKSSDTFIIYQMKQKDVFPFVAVHYGVPYGVLMKDNHVQDPLLVENNTIFIRNPQQNQDNPYNPPPLTDEQKRQIDSSLMGRQQHCIYGFEPINFNTGNFFVELEDAFIEELGNRFSVKRSYNSKGEPYNSFFGRRWSFNYCENLIKTDNGTIIYFKADGAAVYFEEDGNGGYIPPLGLYYNLTAIFHSEVVDEETVEYYTYEIEDRDKTVTYFDMYGVQTEIKTIKGHVTQIVYDEDYILKEIIGPFGDKYIITVDQGKKITQITLPNGGTLQYGYNSTDDLVTFTDALGQVTTYNYDENHYMTSWIDQNENIVCANVYDNEGKVVAQKDGNDHEVEFIYDEGFTEVHDPEGNISKYFFDEKFRITKVENADGSFTERTYDSQGNLESIKDEAGLITEFTYDLNGNVLSETRADNHVKSYEYNSLNLKTKVIDFDGSETNFDYDLRGNLIEVVRPDESVITFEYDNLSRMVKKIDPMGNISLYSYDGGKLTSFVDPMENEYEFSYNEMNQRTQIKDPEENLSKTVYNLRGEITQEIAKDGGTTSFDYDNAGYVVKITDPRANETTFVHDGANKVIEAMDPKNNKTEYIYDKNNLEIKSEDQRGLTKTKSYDSMKRITEEVDGNGIFKRYSYDLQGNIISKEEPNDSTTLIEWDQILKKPTKITKPDGTETIFAYDKMGRLIQVVAPNNGMTFYEYNIMGRIVKIVDPLCYLTEMDYDLNGNITQIRASENRVFNYEYDKNNNLIKTINPLNEEAEFFYDGLNRTIKIINEGSYETDFVYDPVGRLLETKNALDEVKKNTYDLNGNRISFEDPNKNIYSYEFDELNHLTKIIDPLLHETSYKFDESENLVKIIDALLNTTEYKMNEGTLIKKTIDCKGRFYEFEYDAAGNNVKIVRPDETEYSFVYDNMKRIIKETSPKGLIREYSYNTIGKLEKVWDNAGNSMEYEYDLKGQLIKKTDVLERTETYSYNSLGKVTQAVLFDTRENNYSYDLLGRMETFTDAEGKVTTYSYDSISNLVQKQESKDLEERTFKYSYSLNRLVESLDPLNAKTEFEHDSNGNLTKVTDAKENTITYSYNALNLLDEFKDKNGNISKYAFDPLKRLIEIEYPDGGTREYIYDCVGNLIKEIDPLKNEKNYEFDSLNNLVKVTYPEGGEISYKYDAHRVLEEVIDQIGAVTRYETNLNDRVTKITKPNGGEFFYGYDELSRLTSIKTPDELITEFVYDNRGN